MADAERPPLFFWSDDAGSDGERAGPGGEAAARAGLVAGLAGLVAMTAGLVLVVVEPRSPGESGRSEQAREPRSVPSSQPAAAGEAAVSPREPSSLPAADEAADAIGEFDALAPAPELPAAAPEPAQEDVDGAGDDANTADSEPLPGKQTVENRDGGADADDMASERMGGPGVESRAP